jgi:hypothetical protein
MLGSRDRELESQSHNHVEEDNINMHMSRSTWLRTGCVEHGREYSDAAVGPAYVTHQRDIGFSRKIVGSEFWGR